jgi:Tol biopolymer transport system component
MMTGVGMILGTAAYMSPEQAKGRLADRRSDIWSFGCVLFEMLTGRRLFEGDDISEVMADVIKGQVAFDTLPGTTPDGLRRLLRRCLRKDPPQRLDSAAAARIELDEVAGADAENMPIVSRATSRPRLSVLAGAVVVSATIAAGLTWFASSGPPTSAPALVTRFEINPPVGQVFPGANLIPRFAVSPDGRSVAVEVGSPGIGPYRLWIRRFDQIEGRMLQGTTATVEISVQGPFWFPDGETLGFFDEGAHQLKTVSLLNDQVRTLAEVAGNQYGGAANRDGVIIYSSIGSAGIMRVSANGGAPQRVTSLADGETFHLWPFFLPDGSHFLYLALTQNRADWAVFLGSLDGQASRRLVESDSMAQLAAPDQLLFVRGDSLFAQRMDLSTGQLLGNPVLVAQPMPVTAQGRGAFSVSATGTLVHASGAGQGTERDPTWVDRNGRESPTAVPRRRYSQVRLSPDGTKAVLTIADVERDLWLWSFSSNTLTRLTYGAAAQSPAWTPDSKRIAYVSGGVGSFRGLFLTAADGSSKPDQLVGDGAPSAFTADGESLLIEDSDQAEGGYNDVYQLAFLGGSQRQVLIGGPRGQAMASVSPDGRWVAYQSTESNRAEIMVRPFPSVGDGRWQVSTMGGTQPVWSRDGRELFYVSLDSTMMSIPVGSSRLWTAETARPLFTSANFSTGIAALINSRATYDVAADGRFLILKAPATLERPLSANLVVVNNWQQELAPRAAQ